MRQLLLSVIKLARRVFYNTPVHRSAAANVVYGTVLRAALGKTEVTRVSYEGCTFDVPTRDRTILPSLLNNSYEKRTIALLGQVLEPGMTFVDVGANIGLYTVIASRLLQGVGHVYSFEPEPTNYSFLEQNVRLNDVPNAHLEKLALGNRNATASLKIDKGSIGTHSLLDRGKSVEREIAVDVVRLDDYFRRLTETIDVLKVDVEGFEPLVLEGAGDALAGATAVFFEFNRDDVTATYGIEKLLQLLQPFPYVYGINERTQTVRPFSSEDFYSTKYLNLVATKAQISPAGRRVRRGLRLRT